MKQMVSDDIYMFLGGIIALVVGMSVITFHNIWNSPLAIVISLFGWLGVLKGLILILFPEKMKKDFKKLYKSDNFVFGYGFVVMMVGFAIAFCGFWG